MVFGDVALNSEAVSSILACFFNPLIEGFEQLARFPGFLLGEVIPFSHVVVQTVEFGLVLIHPVNELPAILQDRLTGLSSMPRVGIPPGQEGPAQRLRLAVNQWN